jgi:signal transduction histidine kinase
MATAEGQQETMRKMRRQVKLRRLLDRVLVGAISFLGLAAIVAAVYFAIVVGLGRRPTDGEGTLLLLSMLGAAVAAVVYAAARDRVDRFARRLVYGVRPPPSEALRAFSGRMTRSLPLDELLLQLAELLRRTLALDAAEVWIGTGERLERAASDPDRGPASLNLSATEAPVLARSSVAGPAWLRVWLPGLFAGREEAELRVAPITHSGDLLGLIVAERRAASEQFSEEDEQALVELARQVGLALRNVRLDSELRASLEALRQQAEELRASRARVVAAADAERRRIERDLHDSAQQHLMALAINVRLAAELLEESPDEARGLLEGLEATVQEALEALRDLAHGIFPPLLADRGLAEALTAAARRAPGRARIQADGIGRYAPDVEATVYFCTLEALQNAWKHAGPAATVTVRIWEQEGGLLFEASDGGGGFDPERTPRGAGLTSMADRLGAIGGSLSIDSAPGRGTRVTGAIPLRR